MAVVVVAGLASRAKDLDLPPFIADYGGDTLYGTMVVLIVGSFTRRPALPGLVVCWAVEFAQLAHPAWLVAIRATAAGGLVLGHGFLWSDLFCYAFGACIGWGIDAALRRVSAPSS